MERVHGAVGQGVGIERIVAIRNKFCSLTCQPTHSGIFGPDPNGAANTRPSALHADLVDASIGGASCTGDAWCTKAGYQFRINATCLEGNCLHFVAVAKPESENTGTRNFCVTDDGVIRYNAGGQLSARVTFAECKKWPTLQ